MLIEGLLRLYSLSKAPFTKPNLTLNQTLPLFQTAFEDTFKLERKGRWSMADLSIVESSNLKRLLENYDLRIPGATSHSQWDQTVGVDALVAVMKREPKLVTQAVIQTGLDYAQKCPGKQHYVNSALSPENNPRPYAANLWSFLTAAADVSPHTFKAEDITAKLVRLYTNSATFRPAAATSCLTNLYFKHQALSPKDFISTALLGIVHDAFIPQADALGGKAAHHLVEYDMKSQTELSHTEWDQRRKLTACLTDTHIQTVRTLTKSHAVSSPALKHDLSDVLSFWLRDRPELARKEDCELLYLDAITKHGWCTTARLDLSLSLATSLAKEHPDWDWKNVHEETKSIRQLLQNPRGMTPETGEGDGLLILGWERADQKSLRRFRKTCQTLLECTKSSSRPEPTGGAAEKTSHNKNNANGLG